MTSEDDDTVVGSAMWRSTAGKMNRRLWDMSRCSRAGQRWQGRAAAALDAGRRPGRAKAAGQWQQGATAGQCMTAEHGTTAGRDGGARRDGRQQGDDRTLDSRSTAWQGDAGRQQGRATQGDDG